MKRIYLFSILIVCLSNTKGQSQKIINDFAKLAWLEGTWNRTNVKPGRNGNEHWTKMSETELNGLGLTMKGQDTVSLEKLKLMIKDANIFYVADVPENKGPVYFRLTEVSETSFSCENPDHDFPKKIIYQRDGKKLKATISGNGRSIDYFFEKVQ
jgi:hypothetical protein